MAYETEEAKIRAAEARFLNARDALVKSVREYSAKAVSLLSAMDRFAEKNKDVLLRGEQDAQ